MTTLSLSDFASLSPLLILLATGMIVLLIETFLPRFRKSAFIVTSIGLLIAIWASYLAPKSENPLLTPWLVFDSISRFFTLFFLAIGLCVVWVTSPYFQKEAYSIEYYFLLLTSVTGLILIGQAADFLTLFIGIETLSLSLYILCGYVKKWKISQESAIKYFLIGSLAAAFLLYGIALIYGALGTTHLGSLLSGWNNLTEMNGKILFLSGIAMVTLALAIEAAVVPFQAWAPDVYSGASTPVTAFMAVGTKVGAFAAFIRIFLLGLPQFHLIWNQGVAILACATLIYANFVALKQTQLRRFFAYSGISHAGFLLIPLVAGSSDALSSLLYYLVVYALATLGSFAVLILIDHKEEGVSFHQLRGLFHRSPILCISFSFFLLTLAGIPPTAGFLAKFYLFKIAFQAGYSWLIVVGLLTTILSAFYYLRIITIMLSEGSTSHEENQKSFPATFLNGLVFAGLIFLSLFPSPLIALLSSF